MAGLRRIPNSSLVDWAKLDGLTANTSDLLESTDLKTINGNSLIGTGDIVLSWTWDVTWPASSVDDDIVVFSWLWGKIIKAWNKKIADLQDKLESAVNIKTINGESLLGNTDIVVWWDWDVTTSDTLTEDKIIVGNGTKDIKTSTTAISDLATKQYVDDNVAWLLTYVWIWDASVETFPIAGSWDESAVMKWDSWYISVSGVLWTTLVNIWDLITAGIDTPWQTEWNWNFLQGSLWYVAENVTNKKTSLTDNSDTYYPTQKAVKTAVDAKISKATNITSLNDSWIANGHIAVFNYTYRDIRTSSKTIVTTLWADNTTVPTSKAVADAITNAWWWDMTKTMYDPTNVEADAFSMDNMVETETKKVLTATERTAIGTIWDKITTGAGNADSSVSDASTTVKGKVELAINTEVNTGTSDTLAVTPDALAWSYAWTKWFSIIAVASWTSLTVADGKAYVVVPECMNWMNLVRANAVVNTAGTTNATTIDIYNVTDSHDMLSTAISIASGGTVWTAGTVDASYDDIATNDVLRIDVTTMSTTAPKGLMVVLEFRLP